MSNGLSTQNFMSGLMQGASFVNGFQQQKRANDIRDKQLAMQEETHDQQTKLNDLSIAKQEESALIADFDRDTRALEAAGKAPDQDFWTKYAGLGINKLQDDDKREHLMKTGTLMHRAVTEDKWDNDALDGINMMLKDDLSERTKKDGLGRRIIGVRHLPTGKDENGDGVEDERAVPILEVTRKDGSKYEAPLTRQGTTSEDDDLFLIDDNKIDEWHKVAVHQADMAYNLQRSKNDPKAFAKTLREIVLGKQAPAENYEIKEVYDDTTGTKRVAAITKSTGRFSHWVGGASVNDGRGGSGSGSSKNKNGAIDVEEYLKQAQEIRTSTTFVDESERAGARQQLDNDFEIMWGATPAEVMHAQRIKRDAGNFTPLTLEEMAAIKAGFEKRGRDNQAVSLAMASNPDIFGSDQQQQPEQGGGLAEAAAPPRRSNPDQISAQVAAQASELEQKAQDPAYPENARAKFQAQADELRRKNTVAASAPPKPATVAEKRQQRINELQAAIQSGQGSLSEIAAYASEMAKLMAEQNAQKGQANQLAGF